jgi:hypothetical protein
MDMESKGFNPWKNVDSFGEHLFTNKGSELLQWPIKLWKVSPTSPYFHQAHLLVAADCSAFSYPEFHQYLSRGKVPVICCPESDFDIVSKLEKIFSLNEICSVTVVKMDKPCCEELTDYVRQAVKVSRLPVPIKTTCLFVDAEEID